MNEQTKITFEDGEEIILPEEVEKLEKQAEEYQKAINRAQHIIRDAAARYIKEKTRARSKKAAMERDEALQSPRFKALDDFDRFEDIQDAYGWDFITEAERDRLEALWEERENIRNHTGENGIYTDLVTRALGEAETYVLELWFDEIQAADIKRKEFDRQRKKAEEEYQAWKKKNDEEYEKLTGKK